MPRAKHLAKFLRKQIPGLEVKLEVGPSSSFEVSFAGQLLHSKLATGKWADGKAVADAIKTMLGMIAGGGYGPSSGGDCSGGT